MVLYCSSKTGLGCCDHTEIKAGKNFHTVLQVTKWQGTFYVSRPISLPLRTFGVNNKQECSSMTNWLGQSNHFNLHAN